MKERYRQTPSGNYIPSISVPASSRILHIEMATSLDKNEILHFDEKADSVSVEANKPHQVVQIDNVQVLGLDPADAEFYINFSEERRKKVIHKVRPSSRCLGRY
jgi:hypothetical protein